jgi:hypothetical protein
MRIIKVNFLDRSAHPQIQSLDSPEATLCERLEALGEDLLYFQRVGDLENWVIILGIVHHQ